MLQYGSHEIHLLDTTLCRGFICYEYTGSTGTKHFISKEKKDWLEAM
jgi:hypothetical protein